MNKNILIGLAIVLIVVFVAGFLYVQTSRTGVEDNILTYLEDRGYTEGDISNIKIKHSYLNVLLSYNQWTILVTFTDEPNVLYHYTIKAGEIVQSGVSGGIDNKDDLKHLD